MRGQKCKVINSFYSYAVQFFIIINLMLHSKSISWMLVLHWFTQQNKKSALKIVHSFEMEGTQKDVLERTK